MPARAASARSRATRLHVIGCHRSGTTLVTALIGNCFHIDGRADHEQSLWDPIPLVEGIYLTKKPPDTLRIKRTFLLDPHLYVVAMIRDPRGVITSRHPVNPEVFFSSFWRWEAYMKVITALEDHPRFLALRYEDLVTDPDGVQGRIQERFPFLEPRCPFSVFPEGADVAERAQESLNGVRAIDRASLTRWREEPGRVKGELQRHPQMVDWLVRLGYEQDSAWTAELDAVEPYFGTYRNRPPPPLRRFEAWLRYNLKMLAYLWRRRVWQR